jgi:autotransporter-associated beta strand protein
MILTDSNSAYAGSNQVRSIASFDSNLYHFTTFADTTLSRVVSGSGIGILKNGPGVLTLSASNTYTGPTLAIAGTLATSAGNRIPDASDVIILSGATIVLGGAEQFATLAGAGTLNCQANNITLNSNNNSTFSGTLTSTANSGSCIYKQGNNTITLSEATIRVVGPIRMDTGGMTLNDNTSFIQNRTSGSPRDFHLSLPAGTTFNLSLSGGASLTTTGCMFGENSGGSATVNLLSGATWNSGSGNGQTWMAGLSSIFNIDGGAYSAGLFYIGGGVAAQNPVGIINLNSGSFGLTNTLTWQGAGRCVFNLNGGTATFSNFGQSTLTDNTFNFNGGTFTIQNSNSYNYNLSSVKYIVKSGGAIFDVPSGRTITLTTSVLSADSVSTGGGLVKNGAGTLSLGSVANTFTGQVSANEGTITVTTVNNNSTNGPLGNSNFPIVLGSNGKTGTLRYTTASNVTTTKNFVLPSGAIGAFDITGAANTGLTVNGIISGSGSLLKTGQGVMTYSGNNTYTGGTSLSAGINIVGSDTAFGTGTVNLDGGGLRAHTVARRTLTNNIIINSSMSFNTTVGEKSLILAGPVTVTGFRQLGVATGTNDPNEPLIISGPIGDEGNNYQINKSSAGILVLSGQCTFGGPLVLQAGNTRILYPTVADIRTTAGTLQFAPGITNDISSSIRNNTQSVKIDTNGQDVTFASLSSSNTAGLLKTGTGTLILTGSNNTYMSNNGTTTCNGGTLTFAGTHRTPAVIAIGNTGTITISGSLTQTANPAGGPRSFTMVETNNAVGTLNIVSGATVNLSGGLMMGGNTISPTGIINMFGGTLNTNGGLWPCGNSVINMYNGTLDTGGIAIYHGGGGSTPNTNMTCTINVSGGLINATQLSLGLGQLSGANTVTNLVSGTLSVTDVNDGSRPDNKHTFYFNGGTLNIRATSTFPAVSSVVRSGGAILDIGGTVTTSSIFSDGGGGGGFTKLGSGLFVFNSINTYTGTTNVSAGTLRVLKKISGTGSDASFGQADFTPTTLTVTFVSGTPPSAGNTYKLFSGATQQTYGSVTLVNYNGTASYNSTNSTLTIDT